MHAGCQLAGTPFESEMGTSLAGHGTSGTVLVANGISPRWCE